MLKERAEANGPDSWIFFSFWRDMYKGGAPPCFVHYVPPQADQVIRLSAAQIIMSKHSVRQESIIERGS